MFDLINSFLKKFFEDANFRSFVLLIMLIISWSINSKLRERLAAAEHKLRRISDELP